MTIELHTERLRLRRLEPTGGDAAAVLDYFKRNERFLEAWEVKREASYYTLDAQTDLLRQDQAMMNTSQMSKFWLYKCGEPERIIGSVALSNIVRGAFLSCHLGYRLDEAELNKGFMTEAIGRVVAYAFEELGLHRIEANIMPRNTASLKVVEKLGFRDEGLALRYLKINGKWEDHIHMVLLNEELE
ncbi:GNAT family protein [Paenibacillus sp. LHD-117]|uniref:GNAT family N-acetyltransferase n=1 Tax=Paenibacillus sp. LHD-117 TaxID=3071412 RepID=UPI0027DFF79A|nr:GNAT family protein [Paenibacillus sp. LHD-117]MDQ6421746.1 GNAT family protein [Paenibacillus sp. LHD-117]